MPANMTKILSEDQIKAIEEETNRDDDNSEGKDGNGLPKYDDPNVDYFKIGNPKSLNNFKFLDITPITSTQFNKGVAQIIGSLCEILSD